MVWTITKKNIGCNQEGQKMRNNEDGQGVIPGVATTQEIIMEDFRDEHFRLENLFLDKHHTLTNLVSKVSSNQTYKNLNKIIAVCNILESMLDLETKNVDIGKINYALDAKQNMKIKYSYKKNIYNDDEDCIIGKETLNIDKYEGYCEPLVCKGFDYLVEDLDFVKKALAIDNNRLYPKTTEEATPPLAVEVTVKSVEVDIPISKNKAKKKSGK